MAEKGKFYMTNSFVKRNLVTIVMIPSLIAMHYGWVLLQNNEALIKKEERMELPIITAVKYVWSKMPGALDFQNESINDINEFIYCQDVPLKTSRSPCICLELCPTRRIAVIHLRTNSQCWKAGLINLSPNVFDDETHQHRTSYIKAICTEISLEMRTVRTEIMHKPLTRLPDVLVNIFIFCNIAVPSYADLGDLFFIRM